MKLPFQFTGREKVGISCADKPRRKGFVGFSRRGEHGQISLRFL
jgi:hypothetical protein